MGRFFGWILRKHIDIPTILEANIVRQFFYILGTFSLEKKMCEISHLGGGLDKIGSFSHFSLFFFFYVLNHANLQRNFFLVWGGGYPLTSKSNFFFDILGKNLVIFYKFSRFISEKINSFYQNMFQLMCEKKKSY